MKVKDVNRVQENPDLELEELQLSTYEQAMDNIRSFLTMGTQILSVLAIANITVLGFAFSSRKASTLLLGAILMLIALVLHRSIRKWMIPYLFAAVLSERSIFTDDTDPTLSFASLLLGDPDLHGKVDEIMKDEGPENRQAKLVNLALPRLLPDHIGTYAFIWLGLIGQLLLLLLLLLFGWEFM